MKKENHEILVQYAPVVGTILVVSGLLFLLDQRIQTKWLSLSIPLAVGLILITAGYLSRKKVWLISGWIILGIGGVLFFLVQEIFPISTGLRFSIALGVLGLSWLLLFCSCYLLWKRFHWWMLLISMIGVGLSLSFSRLKPGLLDFVLFCSLSVSVVFLAWGYYRRKMSLIIPALLLSTIGGGVYSAWSQTENSGGLRQTGLMLAWFALGWILITVVSRIIEKRFLWWPLIPGGILLMVGSGLYIGGNPENALGFLGNTGSVALILLGIYLILLRFSIKK